MKKVLVSILMISAALMCGCKEGNEKDKTTEEARYEEILNYGTVDNIYTFQDPGTGVWCITRYRCGITPRLNKDGSLYEE